jgi:predicted nucleic acid-binding Zn ribbon protein
MQHKCEYCGMEFIGRVDKRFCSDQCRASFHNEKHKANNIAMIQINKILKNNRRILKKLNPIGKTTVPKSFLELQGFDFRFYTHLYSSHNNTYFFCYEYGYLPLPKEQKVVVINWQGYMKTKMKDSFHLNF